MAQPARRAADRGDRRLSRVFPYTLTPHRPPQLGLVVLQADETLELEFRGLIPPQVEMFVSRVPSGVTVTPETLAAMEGHLAQAASLFPHGARFASVAYACTSGAAQIGPARVADCIRQGTRAAQVTDPVTALVAACRALEITRLALLTPYSPAVSDRLRQVLAGQGIATPVFGSFELEEEAKVVRIDADSIRAAATALAQEGGVDALFLSCTNLRTFDLIAPLEGALGLPVLSSNQVLGWHLLRQAGVRAEGPGRLFQA